ncbi:hypothetical protein OS493_019109 [Desmophyllum pertusum]|uniref:HYR domain-containing protein n=1 Tax=Desmophyllum pertusum TaxID=174260 RepID=A0A9W9YN79_9CNID|nr:hypothetical protein OS493_019109 [Desmophyllum pertusum]
MRCPSDIRASISINSTALVNWTEPVALDNSNLAPQVTVSPPGISPPHIFNETTLVVYTAIDASGNERQCSFRVILEDNLGPMVVYCPPDQSITATQMNTLLTWNDPKFKDNSNTPLVIRCSHQSGTQFYWGTWNVHCTAFDNNPDNNPAVCQFTLRIKPKKCPALTPPKDGAMACDDWMFGRFCSPFCNNKTDFAQPLPTSIWACGAKGFWLPPIRWPDCTKVYNPNEVRMAMDLHYYYGDCTTPEAQAQIQQNFIKLLNESQFQDACRDPSLKDKCIAENVKVTCSLVDSVTSRKKRAIDEGDHHSRTRRSLVPRTTINLVIVVSLDGIEANDTKESQIMIGEEGIKIAKDISSQIKNAVDNGNLSLTINGTVFIADKQSLNISDPKRFCTRGQTLKGEYCLNCTAGTYLNKTLGTCEDCPIGTYQELDAQERCMTCPQRTSTTESRTDNSSSCLGN